MYTCNMYSYNMYSYNMYSYTKHTCTQQVEEWYRANTEEGEQRRVFLATDDPSILQDARNKYVLESKCRAHENTLSWHY